MSLPGPAQVHRAVAATWPAVRVSRIGPVLIREGRGGGSRVSAATVAGPVTPDDLDRAEAAMRDLGQVPLFMLRDGEDALDARLAARGYAIMDPVVAYAAPVAAFDPPPAVTTFEVWPPLAVQRDIWAMGGIGPARLAVMDRVHGPRVSILGRMRDSPAGAAFVACDGPLAMIHAIEVIAEHRRHGMARLMLRAAAIWAGRQGAAHLALVVTRANLAACGLYASCGMLPVAQYHYRILTDPP